MIYFSKNVNGTCKTKFIKETLLRSFNRANASQILTAYLIKLYATLCTDDGGTI